MLKIGKTCDESPSKLEGFSVFNVQDDVDESDEEEQEESFDNPMYQP